MSKKQDKCLTPLTSKNKNFLSSSSLSSNNNKPFITNPNIQIDHNVISGFRKHQPMSSQVNSIIELNSNLISYNNIVNNNDQNIRMISVINNTESSCETYSKINADVSYCIYNSNIIFDENYQTCCKENSQYLEKMINNEQKYMTSYTKKYYVPTIFCQARGINRLRNEKAQIQLARTPKKKVITDGDQYYIPYIVTKSKSKSKTKKLVTSYSKANKLTRNKPKEAPKNDFIQSDFFSYGFKGIKFTNTLSNEKQPKSIPKKNVIHHSNTENVFYKPLPYHHNTKAPYVYSSGVSTNSSSTSQHAANKKRIEKLKELKKRLENMKDDDEDYDIDNKQYFKTEAK